MSILIRHVIRSSGGQIQRRDSIVPRNVVSIGRATDQDLHIPDRRLPLQHSEIRSGGAGKLSIRTNAGAALFVNEERTNSTRLVPGDLIEISNWRILVSDPMDGHDHVLLVEPGEAEESEETLATQFPTSLEQTGLSRRMPSWSLFAIILVACLVVPAAGVFSPDLAAKLRATPLPDDGQWDSGPLHNSHRFIGDNCSACHVEPFRMVRDAECVGCHSTIEHHVDTSVHDVPELDSTRCASCHKEHNEPQRLVRTDQEACATCHADIDAHASSTTLLDVTDFHDDHPEFRVSTVMAVGEGHDVDEWKVERVSLDDPALVERSNLKFPHDLHLDTEGINSPTGKEVLECADCHRPNPGGAYMEPIRMEQHCARCHALQFDPGNPARTVPHGRPEEVVQTLEEFYSREFLLNNVGDTGGGGPRARRQGRRPGANTELSAEERALGIRWAQERAAESAEEIFERRTCADCHTITAIEPEPGTLAAYAVNPVHLTQVWMPKSRFDHDSHVTESCQSCHDAETSDDSADVLMPDIASCRECHGGEHSTGLLASTCIECHVFHIPGMNVMRPEVAGAVVRESMSALERVSGRSDGEQ